MGVLYVDVDVVAFCLLVFLRTVRLPFCMSAAVCWRSTADPVNLGIGVMSVRALLYEVSVQPCWEISPSQDARRSRIHLRKQSIP